MPLGGGSLGGFPLGGSAALIAAAAGSGGKQAFTLPEATLSLYPSGADGEALLDRAVWWGACANTFRHEERLIEKLFAPTGASHQRAQHIDEEHELTVGRTWFIPNATLRDFRPARNQRYVLVVVWVDPATSAWHRNLYFGVTFRSRTRSSVATGAMQFIDDQVWRAERYEPDSGATAYTPVPPPGTEVNLPFFHEARLDTGNYFLGHYRFSGGLHLLNARVIARAPQTTAHTLTLEVDGALTGTTLTIPVGSVGAEVSNESGLDLVIAPGATLRWKVTAGPASAGDRGTLAAITLQGEAGGGG